MSKSLIIDNYLTGICISGPASKKSLEIYQHLSLDAVDAAYQQAVRLLDL